MSADEKQTQKKGFKIKKAEKGFWGQKTYSFSVKMTKKNIGIEKGELRKGLEISSIADYLRKYELKSKKSLGKKHLFRKKVLKAIDFSAKLLDWGWKLSKWSFFRLSAMAIVSVLIFSSTYQVLSAPKSKTITAQKEWEAGELSKGKVQFMNQLMFNN